MKLLLTFICILLLTTAFAQKREEIFDYSFKAATISPYYFVVTEKQDSLWHRKAFYLSQKSQAMEGWYKDEKAKVEHGLFRWFHTNLSISSEGRYVDGKKDGVWLTWNEKGELTDSSNYRAGHRINVSMHWHENGMARDSFNFDGAGNGVQVSWYDDGHLASAGRWKQDTTKVGRWNYYHKNGKVMATEDFNNGKKLATACFDENGVQLDATLCEEKEAEPNGGKEGWKRFLERNLLTLIEAKSKVLLPGQYMVPVRFLVEKDGSLSNFTAFTNFGHGLEEELIKILKRAPRWKPGRQWGRAVKSYHTQPVTFQIQAQ